MVFIGLYILSSSTSYFMFAYIFSWALVQDFGWVADDNETLYKYVFILLLFVVQFMGCLPKSISALRYFTLISAIIISYVGIVIIADYFQYHDAYVKHFGPDLEVKTFDGGWGLATSYGLSLFSAVNQFAVCNIVSELKRPSSRRLTKTIGLSYIFPIIIYMIVGVFGYISYGNEIPNIIITRKTYTDSLDIPMTIARILLIFV